MQEFQNNSSEKLNIKQRSYQITLIWHEREHFRLKCKLTRKLLSRIHLPFLLFQSITEAIGRYWLQSYSPECTDLYFQNFALCITYLPFPNQLPIHVTTLGQPVVCTNPLAIWKHIETIINKHSLRQVKFLHNPCWVLCQEDWTSALISEVYWGVSKALFFKNKQAEMFHRGSSLSINISSNANHKKVKFNHVLTKNLISCTTQNRQTNSPNSKGYTILHSVWTYGKVIFGI